MKLRYLLICLPAWWLAPSAHARKVAIIVQSSPAEEFLNFDRAASDAAESYAIRGYDPIMLGGRLGSAEATRENLLKKIEGLKDVDDLHIEMVGHGLVTNAGQALALSKYKLPIDRFPVSNVDAEEVAAQVDHLPKNASATGIQWVAPSDLGRPETFIGAGDLKDGLSRFKKQNPNARETVNLMNCFSGNVVDGLADLNSVFVTASSPRFDVAAGIYAPSTKKLNTFNEFYYESIKSGKAPIQAYLEAERNFTRTHAANESPVLLSGLPETSVHRLLRAWCAREKSSQTEATAGELCVTCQTGSLKSLRKVSDVTTLDQFTTGRSEVLAALQKIRAGGACGFSESTIWRDFHAKVEGDLKKIQNLAKDKFASQKELAEAFNGYDAQCNEGSLKDMLSITTTLPRIKATYDHLHACITRLKATPAARAELAPSVLYSLGNLAPDRSQAGQDAGGVFLSDCKALDAKIKLIKKDVTCFNAFKARATDADWAPLNENFTAGRD